MIKKLRKRLIPNLRYLPQSRFRRCGCCRRPSFFISLGNSDEFKVCILCRANIRYEMLAAYLRDFCPGLDRQTVVELDPRSPLRKYLANAKHYTRTYYSDDDEPGSRGRDGIRCEDITRLTFADNSIDVIISSDVLEHVPDVRAAFRETCRVLRPGGFHLFTVPTGDRTFRRAEMAGSSISLLADAEYHSDPLHADGILAFWSFGIDLAELFSTDGLRISVVAGPCGKDGRVLWKAEKRGLTP